LDQVFFLYHSDSVFWISGSQDGGYLRYMFLPSQVLCLPSNGPNPLLSVSHLELSCRITFLLAPKGIRDTISRLRLARSEDDIRKFPSRACDTIVVCNPDFSNSFFDFSINSGSLEIGTATTLSLPPPLYICHTIRSPNLPSLRPQRQHTKQRFLQLPSPLTKTDG
jgi:hypothetical protein